MGSSKGPAPEGGLESEIRQRIEAQFTSADARLTCAVQSGAEYGYALPDRDVHDADASHRD